MGCDFHLSYDNIEDALKNRTKYTINSKQYLLVEFDDLMIPTSMNDAFYELIVAGLQPIITHQERNLTIQRHPERMKEWLHEGCLVQVTAASLTGRFGRTAQSLAMQFPGEELGELSGDGCAQCGVAASQATGGIRCCRPSASAVRQLSGCA